MAKGEATLQSTRSASSEVRSRRRFSAATAIDVVPTSSGIAGQLFLIADDAYRRTQKALLNKAAVYFMLDLQ